MAALYTDDPTLLGVDRTTRQGLAAVRPTVAAALSEQVAAQQGSAHRGRLLPGLDQATTAAIVEDYSKAQLGSLKVGLLTAALLALLCLSRRRAEELRAAGLDHVQISIQAADEASELAAHAAYRAHASCMAGCRPFLFRPLPPPVRRVWTTPPGRRRSGS